ncbi:MAG: hypothetical protein KAR23_01570 [Candidatus Aenigmarchaeota archaeon]|nr:hypothetical protein [Candidatus Aenigmarchaeota archaeon]
MKPYLLGIAGPSASGKSTVSRMLIERYPSAVRINLDDFFFDKDTFPIHNGWSNWELPQNLNFLKLHSVLSDLVKGSSVTVPDYSKKEGKAVGEKTVRPKDIIITEGFYLFNDRKIRDLFNLKIFLDLPEDIQMKRRLERQPDLDPRYFIEVIAPFFRKYGLPAKKHADYVINASRDIDKVAEDIMSLLKERLS